MVVIAGIDLAWSGRKPTGICMLECDGPRSRLLDLSCTPANSCAPEISECLRNLGPNVVAGIDAPLIVGLARRAEADLARAFGRQGVYAYAARADFLQRHGIEEGPRLGVLLAESGWNLDPCRLVAGAPGRHALEVFPHSTTVSLLGSPSALKYKKGPMAARLGPMTTLQSLLREYAERELPCLLGAEARDILEAPIESQPITGLKSLEDKLDAICCAFAAYQAWKFGPAGLTVFGDSQNGYIAVPKPITSSVAPSFP
ncbi:MAG: DUF429 domain-containing protein [Dehalococcoidia bacterium]